MKRLLSVLICVAVLTALLAGCGTTAPAKEKNLSVVTTIFPEYDWVMQILGDKAEQTDVTLLLDNGVDLHSYQPTADDIIKISSCDLFVYVGGESDEWVADALKEATNKDMVVINLLDALGNAVKEEEIKEGMEAEERDHEEDHEEETEFDEHVWLSLKNAAVLVKAIGDALGKIDTDNAAVYSANVSAYTKKMNALDDRYQTAVDNAPVKTVLFGDRFPFRYMTDDYGLTYYAAFAGCSAESEASFETVTFLADKVDELGLTTVLTLEGSDQRIAETVIAATKGKNAAIRSMDSMQSTTLQDVKAGTTYLSVMEKNLSVLTESIGG